MLQHGEPVGMEAVRDILLLVVALGLPAYFVLRFSSAGLLLGSLTMWFGVAAVCEIRYASQAYPDRCATSVWLCVGWFLSLLYCLGLHAAQGAYLRTQRRVRAGRTDAVTPPIGTHSGPAAG